MNDSDRISWKGWTIQIESVKNMDDSDRIS